MRGGSQGEGVRVIAVLLLLLMLGMMGILADNREMRPSITVHDQAVDDGVVQVAQVFSTGPGWVTISRAGEDGPSEIIGRAAVGEGVGTNIDVPVDPSLVTEQLYATLHEDVGAVTAFEYPQADPPVLVNGLVVRDSFRVLEEELTAQEAPQSPVVPLTPTLAVEDQPLVDGTVAIDEAVSLSPAWVVIHADAEGEPGPLIGRAPVVPGVNTDVVVGVDAQQVTPSLHAMLVNDEGVPGEFEFPGADAPIAVGGEVVAARFDIITGGFDFVLPASGGLRPTLPFGVLALGAGLAILLIVSRRRASRGDRLRGGRGRRERRRRRRDRHRDGDGDAPRDASRGCRNRGHLRVSR